MAIFIDLWPCLPTTQLSYAQLVNWGHSSIHSICHAAQSKVTQWCPSAQCMETLLIPVCAYCDDVEGGACAFLTSNSRIWTSTDSYLINIWRNVQSWNRRFGCETIHSKQKFISMNLFQMSCVITSAWSYLSSEVVEAVRGQKHHISAHTLAL